MAADPAKQIADMKTVLDIANMNLAAAVAGYVGAAETAKALEGVIGVDAVKKIEQAMLSALDRMEADPGHAARIHQEIRDIFAR